MEIMISIQEVSRIHERKYIYFRSGTPRRREKL